MRFWSTVLVEELRCVSISSASALTVTLSCPAAMASVIGKSPDWPTVMMTPVVMELVNPDAETVTE